MKQCYKCQISKSKEEFSKNKRYKDGLNDLCKICKKENNLANKEYNLKYQKKYSILNKEKLNAQSKKHYAENKQYYIEYNKSKDKELIKQYNQNQIQKGYKKEWSKNQYKTNIQFKLSQLLRIRLIDALKGKINKFESTLELLGCPIKEFKLYLEQQFKPEMVWENHGEIWEVDHIKACANFDLTDPIQQQKCFHYTNLQPLFKTTEIAKSFGYIDQIGNRNKHKN
jgi:hypothetical protein